MANKGNLKKQRWKANKRAATAEAQRAESAAKQPAPDPLRCPYCGALANLWPSSAKLYYSGDYGPVWVCARWPSCQSWVGCHPGTELPLGRMANKELRQLKQKAHAVFDPLWRAKIALGYRKGHARALAYIWLARELGIDAKVCHIGMFDEETQADCSDLQTVR